jgi:CubicO group peptidase (beta-lactamase class C family)
MIKELIGALSAKISSLFTSAGSTSDWNWQPVVGSDEELREVLGQICDDFDQPAMAVAVIVGSDIIAKAARGVREYGKNTSVDISSRFHIGSTTKSMTAMLLSALVEDGSLSWEMTLDRLLPEIEMRNEYKQVSLHDLLVNRAGIVPFQQFGQDDPELTEKIWKEIPLGFADPVQQRLEMAKVLLCAKPFVKPRTKAVYSNAGWAIAGLIIDKITGSSYESALRHKILDPLEMFETKVGGWPASPADLNQPRGHYPPEQGHYSKPKAQSLQEDYVLPFWMNPSGGVHCSISDLALYVQENLLGLKGEGKLLSRESYKTIHSIQVTAKMREMYIGLKSDADASYGYGWAVVPVEGDLLSIADGSGGTFFARLIVFPPLNAAFCGLTNCGNGAVALDRAIEKTTGFEWNSH